MKIDPIRKQQYKDTLRALLQISSPSGRERPMTEHLRKLAQPLAQEVFYDNYGNLLVHVGGSGERLMLCAHADALGSTIQGRGIAGATLTIPRRYSHSPTELMHIHDAMAMLELLTRFVTE